MMSKKNLLLTSLFLTVAAVATMSPLFAGDGAPPPPPPPPPPTAPGAPPPPGMMSGGQGCTKQAIVKGLNHLRRKKMITLNESVEDAAEEMLNPKDTPEPKAESAKTGPKKPAAAPKSDAAMQAELAEKLRLRAERGSSAPSSPSPSAKENQPPRKTSSDPLDAATEKRAADRFDTIYNKRKPTSNLGKSPLTEPKGPPEAANPWGVKLRKQNPANSPG